MIKKHIPNSLTCCNLISGCIATVFAMGYNSEMALLWIVIGATFDFFDGMSARLLGVSSPIGKELDSLADVVTFGVAPAAMVFSLLSVVDYPAFLEPLSDILSFFAFVMAAFSALRLAKFNLDTRQTTSFIGLPTPANALFWGALIVGQGDSLAAHRWGLPVLIVLIGISCWLMVSEIPMFALKFKQWGWKGNEVRYGFILLSVVLLILFHITAFALIIVCYLLISWLVNRKQLAVGSTGQEH